MSRLLRDRPGSAPSSRVPVGRDRWHSRSECANPNLALTAAECQPPSSTTSNGSGHPQPWRSTPGTSTGKVPAPVVAPVRTATRARNASGVRPYSAIREVVAVLSASPYGRSSDTTTSPEPGASPPSNLTTSPDPTDSPAASAAVASRDRSTSVPPRTWIAPPTSGPSHAPDTTVSPASDASYDTAAWEPTIVGAGGLLPAVA